MAVYSADAVQTINPGEDAVFSIVSVPDRTGLIRHRLGTGSFLLSGRTRCRCKKFANYKVDFGANIAIAEGGTVEPIIIGVTLDGSTIPASSMEVTPAAVENYFHVSNTIEADVFAGCCETITIRNLSSQPIFMKNASVGIDRVLYN